MEAPARFWLMGGVSGLIQSRAPRPALARRGSATVAPHRRGARRTSNPSRFRAGPRRAGLGHHRPRENQLALHGVGVGGKGRTTGAFCVFKEETAFSQPFGVLQVCGGAALKGRGSRAPIDLCREGELQGV